jgi:hypothetical protein
VTVYLCEHLMVSTGRETRAARRCIVGTYVLGDLHVAVALGNGTRNGINRSKS